jgi:hypothetical protein
MKCSAVTILVIHMIMRLSLVWGAEAPATFLAPHSLAVEVQLLTDTTIYLDRVRETARTGQPLVSAIFRVTNVSKEAQSFRVWNCSWTTHWKSSDARIWIYALPCARNFIETQTLAAGESYENKSSLQIDSETSAGEIKFKMGFSPEGCKERIWSNELKIRIIDKYAAMKGLAFAIFVFCIVTGLFFIKKRGHASES